MRASRIFAARPNTSFAGLIPTFMSAGADATIFWRASRSALASFIFPLAADAIPWPWSQTAVSAMYLGSGFGSARRSSHFPKRTIASPGSATKKSIPGIMSIIPGGSALAASRAALSDSELRPSFDDENAKNP
jgi:hypothetical protein